MPAPFCTVETDSEEAARDAGAKQLGALPRDVKAVLIAEGRYRVEVIRAPFAIEVEIAKNGMEGVVARIAPAIGDAPQPTPDDVVRALASGKITVGIEIQAINNMLIPVLARGIEQRGVVVARGARPTRGADAKITRCYEDGADLAPGHGWRIVRDGQVLIEREPATAGEAGFTVSGDPLPAQAGDDPQVAVGPGLERDEDGLCWRARVPGFGYLELDAAQAPRVAPAITISADRLAAYADLRLPGADEEAFTSVELRAAIAAAGVVHGLQARLVAALWNGLRAGRPVRNAVRIALGTPPQAGRDAGIAFAVPVGLSPGALDAKTGSIDYRERRIVSPVSQGERIGTWRPAAPGVDGVGVDGSRLPAAHGAKAELVLGAHVRAGEPQDGSIPLFAGIDGAVVSPARHHVEVADVVELAKDVDYSTGNVKVRGCILIRGSVRSGFRVSARHDVTINGAIEDAVVEAGGRLTVGNGVLGGGHGRVSAKLGLTAHHAQNAHILCGGDVVLKSAATNCVLECAGRLTVSEGLGRLVGGSYAATRGVVARELGSVSAVRTVVAVGMSPEIARRLKTIQEEQQRVSAKGKKLQRSVGASSVKRLGQGMGGQKGADARKLMKARRELAKTESALLARKKHLERSLFAGEPPIVHVLVRAHPGVEIRILDASLRIDDARGAARYRYDPENRRIAVEAL